MKATPMIFNGDMVRALLSGRKVQTRRTMKIQPDTRHHRVDFENGVLKESSRIAGCWHVDRIHKSPYGSTGDLIWVRETCREDLIGSVSLSEYTADGSPVLITGHEDHEFNGSVSHWWYRQKSCPSIHMPRLASRLTLKITNVRVERVQDISDEDAIAEGIERVGGEYSCSPWRNYLIGTKGEMNMHCSSPPRSYMTLWNSTYKNWNDNPYVWVYDFEVIKANVDDVMRGMTVLEHVQADKMLPAPKED